MSDTETPASKTETSAPLFSQANITTGLAVLAVILAGAPYVVPQLQSHLVRNGLMAKPAMVEEAQAALQTERDADAAKQAEVAIAAHHDTIFNDKADPVLGNGPIKVAEFLDYNCAYCRAASPYLKQFLAENPDVTLIVKEYPVVHPPESATLAAYGLAAYGAGKYADVHYALLTEKIHTQADADALMTKAGLDPAQARTAATAPATLEHINRTIMLGSNLGINGTPTFIVGNKMVIGASALEAAVKEERARLKKG